MRELGIQAYRFSTAWSRVLPEGTGPAESARPRFLFSGSSTRCSNTASSPARRSTIGTCRRRWKIAAAGHIRDAPKWFAEYAQLMFRTLGDRVPMWATLNEPWVTMDNGYVTGGHAPGRRDWTEAVKVSQNLLRAHAAAVAAYRAEANGQIGLVVNLVPVHAGDAIRRRSRGRRRMDAYLNRHFLDPALLGTFPDELPEMFGDAWSALDRDEMAQSAQPIDFVGDQLLLCGSSSATRPRPGRRGPASSRRRIGEYTAMGWEIFPRGLADTLSWIRSRYGDVPLYMTENGAAFDDIPLPRWKRERHRAIKYIQGTFASGRAGSAGRRHLRGYFVWSLFDNFEWQHGYSKRFGIVRVDFSDAAANSQSVGAVLLGRDPIPRRDTRGLV